MTTRYTASHTSLRTAGIMLIFTVVFTMVMSLTYSATRPAIEASELREKMRLINDVLTPGSFDNVLLDDYVELGPTPELGLDKSGRVYRARSGGEPVALVIETVARNGYGGHIQLIVAVSADGHVSGVRAISHSETPGLGDYIDPKKDKDKARPWITQFTGLSFADVALDKWKVKRDGGAFHYRVGATISARAVTDATGKALAWAMRNKGELFAAEIGDQI
jgi:electron transport complex protein RnfG